MNPSQKVLDHENKYRYGVLIGNQQEERFGFDLIERQDFKIIGRTTMGDSFNPRQGIYQFEVQKESLTEREYKHDVVNTLNEGQKHHLTYGHGIKEGDFQKRDFKTMNELSYNDKVKPQVSIGSMYYPSQTRNVSTFNRNTEVQKNYQQNLVEIGQKDENKKISRPYNQFTKIFDLNWTKTGLRGK